MKPTERSLVRIRTSVTNVLGDPYELYWIDPQSLKYTIEQPTDVVAKPALASGLVRDGDWDLRRRPVKNLLPVEGARERFLEGKQWPQTAYYRSLLARVNKGLAPYKCETRSDVDRHCSYIDGLYEEIKAKGYRQQGELDETYGRKTSHIEHELTAHIGRDGQFLFCDGRRRLGIALALGIRSIPVKVCLRHARWESFRHDVVGFARSTREGALCEPLTHPDLQLPGLFQADRRFERIAGELPGNRGGELLDIGAGWGYFCHKFEECGFECHALESASANLYFLKKLKLAQDRRFNIIEGTAGDLADPSRFEVVLALNVLHRFLKTREAYDGLVVLLRGLKAHTLFFEAHDPGSKQMRGAFRNYEPGAFVEFIKRHARMKKSRLIGRTADGRPIYKLSR